MNPQQIEELKADLVSDNPCLTPDQRAYLLSLIERDRIEKQEPLSLSGREYLQSKIALVAEHKSWEGVDPDEFINEVRGREPDTSTNEDE